MFTFSHHLAPTVSYSMSLPEAITHYALVHLHEYDVDLFEVDDKFGVKMAVSCFETGTDLGFVTIQ